jgi:uroporphyrinogen decarboxylase
MTSRERILRALDHREPDRCPNYIWLARGMREALERHLGVTGMEAVEAALGVDCWRSVGLPFKVSEAVKAKRRALVPEEVLSAPGAKLVDDGRVLRPREDGSYGDDCAWYPLEWAEKAEDVEAYAWDTPESVPEAGEELRAHVAELKAGGAVVQGAAIQPFKKCWELVGMEKLLCDFLVNPELVHALYERAYAHTTAYLASLARAGVDVVQVIGDIGMQDRMFVRPELWREFDKPRLAALVKTVKGAAPGVKVYMHSDGALGAIVGDLAEAGLDILNPIQPECMDPFEVKREWGEKLVLHGGVSLQRTMPFGTPEAVRAEVRGLIEVCGRGGGYVCGPSNGMTEDIPVENVVALYEATREG